MELAPDPALDRVAGVKLAAVGLNLNSLALGLSLKAGAVAGLPSGMAFVLAYKEKETHVLLAYQSSGLEGRSL